MLYLDKSYIGNFDAKTHEELREYLQSATEQMKGKRIIAPIDGDTWHTYRLVSWDSGFPSFPLEPQNPLWYNDVYREVGFTPLARYISVAFPIKDIEKLPADNNVIYKKFEQADLKTIYNISINGFDKNFLYDEITYEDFYKLYEPILPMVDSDFVLIAYIDGVPCGFMFSVGLGDVFILKTIAVLPEYRKFGIGRVLMNKALLAAQEKGFKTAIGALIIDGNVSHDMVLRYGAEKIREYTLYEHTETIKE